MIESKTSDVLSDFLGDLRNQWVKAKFDEHTKLAAEPLLIHFGYRLLSSAILGAAAAKVIPDYAARELVSLITKLSDKEVDSGFEDAIKILSTVEKWFNEYKCPCCGYDNNDRAQLIIDKGILRGI